MSEFYELSPKEFANVMRGRMRHIEMMQRIEWTRTRWLASVGISPYRKRPGKPEDLIKFPWERLTKKQLEAIPSGDEIMELANKRLKV